MRAGGVFQRRDRRCGSTAASRCTLVVQRVRVAGSVRGAAAVQSPYSILCRPVKWGLAAPSGQPAGRAVDRLVEVRDLRVERDLPVEVDGAELQVARVRGAPGGLGRGAVVRRERALQQRDLTLHRAELGERVGAVSRDRPRERRGRQRWQLGRGRGRGAGDGALGGLDDGLAQHVRRLRGVGRERRQRVGRGRRRARAVATAECGHREEDAARDTERRGGGGQPASHRRVGHRQNKRLL